MIYISILTITLLLFILVFNKIRKVNDSSYKKYVVAI